MFLHGEDSAVEFDADKANHRKPVRRQSSSGESDAPKCRMALGELDNYLQAADRENTLRSYAACIRHFEQKWKGLLPATSDSVARYLAAYAPQHALSTLRQASERDALMEQRREVLQGKPAAEFEAALQAALKASEQAHAAAAEQAKRTQEEAAKRGEAHKIAAQEVTKCTQAKELAAKALADALAVAGLDTATLRVRLAHEEQWVRQERAALTEMDRLHSSESKAVEERHKDLSAHEAQTAPALPLTEIEASLATLEPQHGEQGQQLGAAKQRLEQDNQDRAIGEAKARELERARKEATVWQQLDALIGSADGRKFRKFAQSMTMEILLAHANAELASLAPRYALQRVKAQDLELQVVDRDMGDEIRSTSSLSGGETFLVSLALALGLSSLASEKVRIESLFIDEGFGSLDPKTLETALSTLDSLQSAGRKVGLISHVPGLAERIGVQVLVERQGQGASTVRVVAGGV